MYENQENPTVFYLTYGPSTASLNAKNFGYWQGVLGWHQPFYKPLKCEYEILNSFILV